MNTLTDRQLLEEIYILLIQIYNKVKEIDNDEKQFGMNLLADLVGTTLTNSRQ